MQSPNVSDAKVLKILARKERREQQASPAINLADILSSVSVRKYGSSQAAVGDQNSSAVAQEKANYLSKIKEENEVLKDLLHVCWVLKLNFLAGGCYPKSYVCI